MLRLKRKNEAAGVDGQQATANANPAGSDLEANSGSKAASSSGSVTSKQTSTRLATEALSDRSLSTTLQHVFKDRDIEASFQPHEADVEVVLQEEASEATEVPPRHFVRTHAYTQGITLFGVTALFLWAEYNLVYKIFFWLKLYYAAPMLIVVPIGMIFFAFAAGVLVRGVISLGLGGTQPLLVNSQNYSAIKTPVPKGAKLPQIIVQMPVYKESLEEVIKPSYFNVKRAMDYYVTKGGSVKFIVCDDGLQVISRDEAPSRVNFYASHGIAFVARPPHNRRGVFKKASNLNYQLSVSQAVTSIIRDNPDITPEQALVAVWQDRDREFVGGGDLTMDEDCLILLIDADTKVPEHCMYDVVGEFIDSPELAYTQHFTEPFAEQQRNYWEQYISHFTRIIYMQGIAMSVAYGDNAPLVGHNAFLRWSAIQKVGYSDDSCRPGQTKYWSESSVSEDFDMYIRLSSIGSFGRYVMYTGSGFQEGVSLSYMDEVIKFRKFAYGACEMIFNPFKEWPTKGPFAKSLLNYLKTPNIRWYQKMSLLSYISSYLAMGGAFFFCIFEAVMSVIDPGFHDYFTTRAFDVVLTCNFIFSGVGTFCGGIFFEWRRTGVDQKANIYKIIGEHLKWVPLTTLFFGSILFYITEACFMYFFSLKVTWGATAKTTKKTTCWHALKDTLWGYKYEYIMYVTLFGGYLVCLWYWKIGIYRGFAVPCYMAGHILGPIVLNPYIMTLAW